MTEPFRLPLELSFDETMRLRQALMAATAFGDADPLLRRIEDHTGHIMRERESARHTLAQKEIAARGGQ